MKKAFFLFFIVILVLVIFSSWKVFGPSVTVPQDKFFYIKTGETFDGVRNELLSKKIISSARWFDWVSSAMKFKTVKAGKYEIDKGMSLFELIRKLRGGKQTPVKLTITKLRVKEDLAFRTSKVFEFDSLQAIEFLSNKDSLKKFDVDSNTLMAVILPNTYSFFWNSDPKKVFQRLHDEWKKFWNEERRSKAARKGLTPFEVSTLASIIDEESNYSEEKDTIASVYMNRIKLKMPLQADPTVKFALKDFGLKRIYERHLAVESPFNTYKYAGLPPGPICTAQPETIDAVLNAPETNYLYFVANSNFSGSHVFTTSYNDHLIKAKEYQKALDKQQAIRNANR